MSVDKLVDSTQLDSDLTSVANAIRTKGGTSAQLAFPAGFVSAVEAIPTGGGTNKRYIIKDGEIQDGFTFQVNSPSAISEDPNGFFKLSVTGNAYGFCYANNVDFSNFKYIVTEFYVTSKISGWSYGEFGNNRIVPSISAGSGNASSGDNTNVVYYDCLGNGTGNIRERYSIVNIESLSSGHIKLIVSGTSSHPSAYIDIKNMFLLEEL